MKVLLSAYYCLPNAGSENAIWLELGTGNCRVRAPGLRHDPSRQPKRY